MKSAETLPHSAQSESYGFAQGSSELSRTLALEIVGTLDISKYPRKCYATGCSVLNVGQRTGVLPLIEAGALLGVLRPSSGGIQIVPVTFPQGEFAGLSHLYSRTPVSFDLVTVGTTTLRWVQLEDIEAAIDASHRLLALLARFLAMRLREVQMRERSWLERGVHGRVRTMLLRMAADRASGASAPQRIVGTHEQLAMRCGISRPKLSQELKSLEVLGAIRIGRGEIEILDLQKMMQ